MSLPVVHVLAAIYEFGIPCSYLLCFILIVTDFKDGLLYITVMSPNIVWPHNTTNLPK